MPLDARLGLPEESVLVFLLRDWNQALVVENPFGQSTRCWGASWA